jgi:hypothetical protein
MSLRQRKPPWARNLLPPPPCQVLSLCVCVCNFHLRNCVGFTIARDKSLVCRHNVQLGARTIDKATFVCELGRPRMRDKSHPTNPTPPTPPHHQPVRDFPSRDGWAPTWLLTTIAIKEKTNHSHERQLMLARDGRWIRSFPFWNGNF